MAKNLLTASQVKSATCHPNAKPKRYNDGAEVPDCFKSGLKSWRYNYLFNGKQGTIVHSSYPDVSLAEAREIHTEALIQKNIGIIQQSKSRRLSTSCHTNLKD